MTGRDDKLPSVLVLAQDGRTAPLRTLGGPSTLSGGQNEVFASRLMGTDSAGRALLNVRKREKLKIK